MLDKILSIVNRRRSSPVKEECYKSEMIFYSYYMACIKWVCIFIDVVINLNGAQVIFHSTER